MQITTQDTLKTNNEQIGSLVGLLEAVQDAIGTQIDQRDYQSVAVQLGTGWTGTVTFEVSNGGVIWVAKSLVSSTGGSASTATGSGLWAGDIGAKLFRVRSSTFTTGPVPVELYFSPMSTSYNSTTVAVSGTVATSMAAGATSPAKAEDAVHTTGDVGMFILAHRTDTASVDASATGDYGAVKVDRHGATLVRPIDTLKRTYAAAAVFTPVAGVIFEIGGVASPAVIEINRITLTLVGTAAGQCGFTLAKTSALATVGTPVAMTKVPYDSADAAAGAAVRYFTAAPTPGAQVGNLRTGLLGVSAANVPTDRLRLESGTYSKSFMLLSATQAITLALTGTLPAGAQVALDIEWTEF